MANPRVRVVFSTLAGILTAMGIGSSNATCQSTVQPQGAAGVTPAERARAELLHPRSSAAEIAFMTGMIQHHAQALVMSRWCPSHSANAALQALCERITVSQTDEVKFMQGWLRDRHQPVPGPGGTGTAMPGMAAMSDTLMPGMLTASQLAHLDSARGARFDHLFLTDMIMHHRGAIDMVQHLVDSGQAPDDQATMFATNAQADQAAEIGRMRRMLAAMPASPSASDSAR
jgi:uncharacterized protein (DUF305 family)